MKVYYWSPFISNVATTKAVINSIKSISKYSKGKFNCLIVDVFKEWQPYLNELKLNKINVKKLNSFLNIKYLPKNGFFKSRLTYILVFIFTIFKLHNFIRKEKPQYFIIHLITSIPLSLLLLFNYDTKFILRISGYPKLNIFRKILWKSSDKYIHRVFCPTKLTKEFLIRNKIFSEDKIYVVEDPIIDVKKIFLNNRDTQLTTNFDLYDKKIEYVVSIGRLTNQKNFKFLINNFEKILKNHPSLKLLILGEGEQRSMLTKIIINNKLEKNVFLIGSVDNVYPYLQNSLFFVLTSKWEDPGFVLIESMFAKTIVLSSDCTSGPIEIIKDYQNGFLYKNCDGNDFKNKFSIVYNLIKNDKKTSDNIKLNGLKTTKMYTLFNHHNKIIKHIK